MADQDLQKRLEKLGAQLVSDIEAWEQRTRSDRAKVLDELSHSLGDKLGEAIGKLAEQGAKHAERAERRERKREARRRQREARRAKPSVASGVVFLVAAVLCAAFGVLNPQQWWLLFVGLGLALSGAGQLTAAGRARRELAAAPASPVEREVRAPPAPVEAPHEVDALCDRLLADLAAAPDAVRAFVSEPDKTVATLRGTLKSLDLRRRQLRAEDARGRLAEAARLRGELTSRRDATVDSEAKARLEDALRSLAGQEAALGQLAAVTERVDGEYTALLVHLQELRTRVAVARSSQSQGPVDGVRASVQRLNEELGAISEAMDAVRRGDLQPVSELEATVERPAEAERVKG